MNDSNTMPSLYRDLATQEAIDQAYNPSLGLDLGAIVQHFETQSERVRQNWRYIPDVPYGPTREEKLDIFPADHPDAPVLLFIHGGYWRSRCARDFSAIAQGPRELGMTVVLIDYALCPKVTLDEISRQARASLVWVRRHIAQYNGDPGRITLAGHSAGAHLAAMCLQTPWQRDYGLPQDLARAALLISGIYDIAPLRYSYLQPAIQLDSGIIARNSPMFGVQPSQAQALLTWGADESSEFARQSQDFLAQWHGAGNQGSALALPGANHYTVLDGLGRADSALCQWLAQHG